MKPSSAIDEKTLTVITFNTMCVPVFSKRIGWRLENTLRTIQDMDPDIILLQEIWQTALQRKVIDLLAYPYYAIDSRLNLWPFYSGSGKIILSKYPVVHSGFFPFPFKTKWFIELSCVKGLLYAHIQHPEFKINVINTHLRAGLKASDKRLSQLKGIETIIDSLSPGDLTILGGDFNSGEQDLEYLYIKNKLSFLDSFKIINNGHPGYTQNHINPLFDKGFFGHEPDMRIDFIYYKNHTELPIEVHSSEVIMDQPVEGEYLSDHFGVKTVFRRVD